MGDQQGLIRCNLYAKQGWQCSGHSTPVSSHTNYELGRASIISEEIGSVFLRSLLAGAEEWNLQPSTPQVDPSARRTTRVFSSQNLEGKHLYTCSYNVL